MVKLLGIPCEFDHYGNMPEGFLAKFRVRFLIKGVSCHLEGGCNLFFPWKLKIPVNSNTSLLSI